MEETTVNIGMAILTFAGALATLIGAAMSVDSILYRYDKKDPLLKNAEWGFIILLILSFFVTMMLGMMYLGFEVDREAISTMYKVLRIFTVFIPLNKFLYIRKLRKQNKDREV